MTIRVVVGICREDNPADVDEAYGAGTYARLFPSCEECGDPATREHYFDDQISKGLAWVCDNCPKEDAK